MITAPKIHTDLLWDLSILFICLGVLYFLAIFFYRKRISATSRKVMQRKRELSPMISEFIFHEEDASKDEKSNYINLKVEIRELIKDDFNLKILSEVLLDLQKDVSGSAQKRLFKLYQDLNLHTDAFAKLKSWKWHIVSKAINDLTQMQVSEAYGFITKFINDKRSTIRKQAEIATVTLNHDGLNYFLDTTTNKISEWQQLKLLDVIRNQADYHPPSFKAWLTSTNSYVVLFALRLIKFYQQNDANASIIELVKHKNTQIKQEAIGCIKDFHLVDALDTLKIVFWKSTTDVKIAILDSIGSLGTEKDIEFLQLIDHKISNFYVKSKALSSINAISPESIMPSEGILDTSNYQIPDDLPIKTTYNPTNDSDLTIAPKDLPMVNDETIHQNQPLKQLETDIDESAQSPVSGDTNERTLDYNFLPLVVPKTPEQNSENQNNSPTSKSILENIEVSFEEVSDATNIVDNLVQTQSINPLAKVEQEDFIKTLAFLPIVVQNAPETSPENMKFEESRDFISIRSLDVQFEVVEKSIAAFFVEEVIVSQENIKKEENATKAISTIELISFEYYHTTAIFNQEVVSEEIFVELTIEQQINNIEVIEPYFLTISTKDLEENLMDNTSNATSANLPVPNEMNPQDEEKFKKIINDLIHFENNDEENEILEEFQNSTSLEFEDEISDIDFIPLVEKEQKEEVIEIEVDLQSHDKVTNNKEKKVIIPKSELSDGLLKTPDLTEMSPEETAMKLLDDLTEMGDQRELPLLLEMLNHEKYASVKVRIKKLIQHFSEDIIEARPTKKTDSIELKAFNVFEDLFRNCDTDMKLILLDEVVAIGDQSDIVFLEELLNDSEKEIRNKAAHVLELLRLRLAKENASIAESSEKNNLTNSIQKDILPSTEEQHEDGTPAEYTTLLEELEINPSHGDNIFDLDFEITQESDDNEQKLEKNEADKETYQKSILGHLLYLSSKIIGKFNG